MNSTRKSNKVKVRSWDMEVICLKAPPRAGEFCEDSDEEGEDETSEYVTTSIRCGFLNGNISLINESNSGNTLAQQVALYTPILYPATATRLPWMEENDSFSNLDILMPQRSLESLPSPYSDSDSIPDLTILRAHDEPLVRHMRPFSAKPRVMRKCRLRADQNSYVHTSSEPEQGTSQTPEILDIVDVDINENVTQEEDAYSIVSFDEIKLILPPDVKPYKPRIVRDYPYTKLQQIPTTSHQITNIEEEDENEPESVTDIAAAIITAEVTPMTTPLDKLTIKSDIAKPKTTPKVNKTETEETE